MKERFIGLIIASLIKAISITLRVSLDDRCGLSNNEKGERSVIWAFWHSKVFLMPVVFQKYFSERQGTVLTSSSRDGQIIVEVMKRFGLNAIRGSTNKSPVKALRESTNYLKSERGGDLAVTPDGPRGPAKVIQPGIIKLAQLANVPIMPISITYDKFIKLKTWDNFQIPLPFCKVDVVLHEFHRVPAKVSKEEICSSTQIIEKVLKSLS